MLDHKIQHMNKFSSTNWQASEWDAIAAELNKRYPLKQFNLFSYDGFTLDEFEEAMETVILQGRHKSFNSFSDVRRPLFEAFQRLYKPSASVKSIKVVEGTVHADGKIVWSPEEWEVVTLEFHRQYPNVFNERCVNIRLNQIRGAVEILPVHRRRYFSQIEIFRRMVLLTWDALPDDIKKAWKLERSVVEFPSGPIVEPPSKKSDETSSMAMAMHGAFKQPTENKQKKRKVYWKPEEWIAVAREMHRQNPHANFIESHFFTIDLPAIRAAQREVLPLERRKLLAGSADLREPLVEAFKILKLEILTEKFSDSQIPVSVPPAMPVPAPDKVIESIPLPTAMLPAVSEPASVNFMARFAEAAKPLISLVAEGLASELMRLMMPEFTKLVASVANQPAKPSEQPVAPPTHEPMAQPNHVFSMPSAPVEAAPVVRQPIIKPPEVPRKPKIVVLGPLGKQKEEIERAFPDYRFAFIEHGHGVKEAGESCVLFIAVVTHTNSSMKQSIKSHVPSEKVRYVNGGTSAVKRQISAWIASIAQS